MKNLFCLLLLLSFCLLSCQKKGAGNTTVSAYFTPVDSGVQAAGIKMITIQTPAGKFKVWTKRFGNNPRIRILLLHGGPAFTHEYMECFESFFPKEGFEMIEYDQLGSYYSDQPRDSSLWTTPRFVEEVEQVRKALNLDSSNFYLLGHSWGGVLAMEYALKYQKNLKGLLVCNMMASMPAYRKYHLVLGGQLRKSLMDSLLNYEAKGLYNDTTYQTLLTTEFYTKHICRLTEWPDPAVRTVKHVNGAISELMMGPAEFKPGGRLLQWDISTRLKEITVPTLMVSAKYDTMDPSYMQWMSRQVKNGQSLFCPNGSHLAMWDDQQIFMSGVIRFINGVDAGK